MIHGIGTDLVLVARVEAALARFGERFRDRVLVAEERAQMPAGAARGRWLAKRWAAKEAVAKAFGTGIGATLGFHDIVIGRAGNGAPRVELRGGAAAFAAAHGITGIHLSLSDEAAHALAFVVLERA